MKTLYPCVRGLKCMAKRMGLSRTLEALRDTLDALALKMGKPPFGAEVEGLGIRGYSRHLHALHALSSGRYEPFFRRLWLASLESATLVVDGGANLGIYTLLASHRIAPNGRVLAFEPDPYSLPALSWNVIRNRCENVVLIPKALSDHVGTAILLQSPSTYGSSLTDRREAALWKRTQVQTTTLDHELKNLAPRSVLIKFDLEGAEPLALEGTRAVLEASESVILFSEINPAALCDGGFSVRGLLAKLLALDFKVWSIDEAAERLVPIVEPCELPKGNVYCTRRKT